MNFLAEKDEPVNGNDLTSKRSFPFTGLFFYLFLAGILFLIFGFLPFPMVVTCTYPIAQRVSLALCAALSVQVLVGRRLFSAAARSIFFGEVFFLLLTLWLGSYPLSPLGFASGRIPFQQGFVVSTSSVRTWRIDSGEIISVEAISDAKFRALTLPAPVHCEWHSSDNGLFFPPNACETSYVVPGSGTDFVTVSIRPGCGLPESSGEIKVAIFP